MKFSKKSLSIFALASVIMCNSMNVFAIDTVDTKEDINNQMVYNKASSNWWTTAWKILKALNNAGNQWINVNPVHERTDKYIKVGSGSIDFNNDKFAGIAEHIVDVDSNRSEIDAWVERTLVDFSSKMNISFYNPNGGLDRNKSVTENQHYVLKPTKTGKWTVRYTTSESKKWSCWFIYVPPVKGGAGGPGTGGPQRLINSDTGEQIDHELYRTDEKIYSMPSENFKNDTSMYRIAKTNDYLTMKDFVLQTYDTNISRFVNSFKDYSVDDTILFKDIIDKVSYCEDINATKFTFMGVEDDPIDWYFNGDLTSKYNDGDTLKLKFKVVNEYKDDNVNFETLDYIKNSANGYANISDYIF